MPEKSTTKRGRRPGAGRKRRPLIDPALMAMLPPQEAARMYMGALVALYRAAARGNASAAASYLARGRRGA